VRLKWKLMVASMKMFFRQREAILWTFLLPLFMITLFGFVKFDGLGRVDLGVSGSGGGRYPRLFQALQAISTLRVTEGGKEAEMASLQKGERDLVLVVPDDAGGAGGGELTVYTNDAKPAETQLGLLVLQRVMDEMTFAGAPHGERVMVRGTPVKSRHLTYIDFLLPGVLSMAIMQMGIFGVAFSFVSLKKRGILRRLSATPVRPGDFILAQVTMRLLVVVVQVGLMVAAGLWFFHLHMLGSVFNMFVLAILGAVVFLAIGFALAGVSKSEDQVAPLANMLTLPMLLLSGVFFSRTNLPGFVHTITGWFPLTFLVDGMRSVAIDGATLIDVMPQVLGLGVWAVVTCAIAIKLFRWE
jgi:ABC-2 type transport system permease protein